MVQRRYVVVYEVAVELDDESEECLLKDQPLKDRERVLSNLVHLWIEPRNVHTRQLQVVEREFIRWPDEGAPIDIQISRKK